MAATDFPAARLSSATKLVDAIEPNMLVYVAVNVGDADCQLLLMPAGEDGERQMMVVDAVQATKLKALIGAFADAGVLGPNRGRLDVVVATHPHADHIRGIPDILDAFAANAPDVWDSGYRHSSPMFLDILDRITAHDLTRVVVAAGMTRIVGRVRVTVLAPSVELQRRYDTYGVNVNDSSASLKIDYPATQVIRDVQHGQTTLRFIDHDIGTTLILGADAQMLSWSHVLADFPQLGPVSTPVNAALKLSGGIQPLKADVFKVPHHGSKHGLTLELIEAVHPKISIVSSVRSGGAHHFPHAVAMAQLREAINARVKQPDKAHDPDEDLALLYTGSNVDTGGAAGSVCVLCRPVGSPQVWRLMDEAGSKVDLDDARKAV
jgi:hypothetical protein